MDPCREYCGYTVLLICLIDSTLAMLRHSGRLIPAVVW